ncbi:hypothetical protein FSHL1_001329 [Fusarium sambucinum]
MATASFHLFSRLPTELQLMIWEEACATQQPHQRAIHHVDIVVHSQDLLLEVIHPGFGNDPFGSACLVNFGLWKACRESRWVITRHFNHDRYNGWTKMKIRGTAGSPNSYCLVDRNEDIFCIRANDWEDDPAECRLWFVGITRALNVKNVAFEFDPTWLIDLPEDGFVLKRESSPRGLLTHLLEDYAFISRSPHVWLIDRETIWLTPKLPKPICVYGDEGYVKGTFDEICSANTMDKRSDALPKFLEDLRITILRGYCKRWGIQPGQIANFRNMDNVPKIKVLLRGCKRKCQSC